MDLILWRHAEAEDGEPDLARKLTGKGEKQARRTAEWLHSQLPQNARIYASPAMRAQQTAKALTEISRHKLRTLDDIAPDMAVADVLAAIKWPNTKATIVLVGHQPTLGQIASELLCGREEPWSIRKGGLWWLSRRDLENGQPVVVRAVISPDLL